MAKQPLFMITPNMKKWLTDLDALSKTGLEEAVRNALKESHNYITPLLNAEIEKHRRTGRTENSLDTNPIVNKRGDLFNIEIGFHITQGGLPSIFLMHGTPKQAPDMQLYNAVFGKATAKKIKNLQHTAVKQALQKYIGDWAK